MTVRCSFKGIKSFQGTRTSPEYEYVSVYVCVAAVRSDAVAKDSHRAQMKPFKPIVACKIRQTMCNYYCLNELCVQLFTSVIRTSSSICVRSN